MHNFGKKSRRFDRLKKSRHFDRLKGVEKSHSILFCRRFLHFTPFHSVSVEMTSLMANS